MDDPNIKIAQAFHQPAKALQNAVPSDYVKLVEQERAFRESQIKEASPAARTLSQMFSDASEEDELALLDAEYVKMKADAEAAAKKKQDEQQALPNGRFPAPPMKEK